MARRTGFVRTIRSIVATVVLVSVATLGGRAQVASALKSSFEHTLQDIALRVDGVVGYEVLDLTSGDRFSRLAGESFPTASTIKLAIVYELFKQVEEGRVRLDDTLVLDRTKAVGGSGVLVHLGTPTLSI